MIEEGSYPPDHPERPWPARARRGYRSAPLHGEDLGWAEFLLDDASCQVGEPQVMVAGVVAELFERVGRVEPAILCQDTLGLLNDDAVVERGLQLLVEHLAALDRPFLQD